MNELIAQSTYFGVVLSLLCYWIALKIASKVKSSLCNPLMVSIVLIIICLSVLGVSYETFNKSASTLTYFLTPTTVCLAVPLYRQYEVLKSNLKAILLGIAAGCVSCMITIVALAKIFAFDTVLTTSVISKSITTAIAIGLTEEMGGIPAITVACIMITGMFGACLASVLCKVFKIEHPVAQGLAIGTCSHALGTSRALEIGEVQGAMSSLAIGIAGIMTVILAPIVMGMIA
jgi:predicted murein hydrolase (TIGR00659 family)